MRTTTKQEIFEFVSDQLFDELAIDNYITEISISDTFDDLGLDQLDVYQFIAVMESEYNIKIKDLTEYDTVGSLVQEIMMKLASEWFKTKS